MQVPSLISPHPTATGQPIERLLENRSISEPEKVAEASRAFEAVLLRQILEEGQRPAFPSTFVNDSCTAGIYRDMVVTQLAENVAQSGTFGLAKSLASQLERQTGTPSPTLDHERAD